MTNSPDSNVANNVIRELRALLTSSKRLAQPSPANPRKVVLRSVRKDNS